MADMSSPFVSVNISAYLTEIFPSLKPPVANRIWFRGPQFFVMIVGGPNKRDDFHYQPGEELFWQLRGGMRLDVMEEGVRKAIPIAEQEMFLLPRLTHHSPQRFPETIGLVCERIRSPDDIDFLKWFYPNTGDILYEEWFNCSDIASQLKAVIERFFASPQSDILKTTPKTEPEPSEQFIPFNLRERIDTITKNYEADPTNKDGGCALRTETIVDGEFVVRVFTGHGKYTHPIDAGDTFVTQNAGISYVHAQIASVEASASPPIKYLLEADHATWFPKSAEGSFVELELVPGATLMMITCVM